MSLTKKLAIALAACALALGAFGLAGCSGESSDDAAEEQVEEILEVTGSGATELWQVEMDDQGNEIQVPVSHYAFTVVNHDPSRAAQNVPFNVTGIDEMGSIVFETDCNASYIYPGITTAISGAAISDSPEGLDTKIAQVIAQPIMNEVQWVPTSLVGSKAEGLFDVVSQNNSTKNDVFTISAAITGNLSEKDAVLNVANVEESALEAHAIAILYDENDNIVMGTDSASVLIDQEFIDKVSQFEKSGESWTDPDANAPANLVASVSNVPNYKRHQLYVMPGLE